MKILHLLKSTSYSGAENVVISIMKNCTGHEMIYASPDGTIRERVQEEGLFFYPMNGANVKEVKKAIEKLKPDVIHAHDFSMSIYASCVAGKIPVISHLHNNPLWIKKLCSKTLVYLLSTRKYKKILTVSDAVEREFLFSRLFSSKIEILENVIDAKSVKTKADEIYLGKKYDVIFLGRLSSQKCPVLFCKIIERVKQVYPQISSVMVGNGEMEAEVRAYIEEHNLNNEIDLIEFQENPYPYLKNAKILLMPSAWEGFGLVAVEAMILGKPVVCSGVGGLKKIVNENCGFVCNNVKEYTDSILTLLQEDELYLRVAHEAVENSKKYTDVHKYMTILCNIYNTM